MRIFSINLIFFSLLFSKGNGWDETLKYSAYFSGIHVANATLKSKWKTDTDDQQILNIEFRASSRSSVNYIFPINDIISIDVDTESWEPIRIEKNLQEGNYRHHSISKFFLEKKIFTFNGDTISFTDSIMNPYSLIYFFRTKKLNPDMSFQINIVDNKKMIPLKFNIESQEKIKLPIGDFSANKVWPERKDGKPFKNAGKITIWYSEKEKIPLMINLKLKFGSLNLKLVEIN